MADPAQPEIRAAGAVLWRRGGAGRNEVALVHRPRYDDWTFPKGKLEPGEHVLMAAVREISEETGVRPVLGRPLGVSRYQRDGGPKRVDYWAAHGMPGTPSDFHPGSEVDRLDWLPVPEALVRLTYPRDTHLLGEFAGGHAETVPLVLLRHASAGGKAAWPGHDLDRPLDAGGAADARDVAEMLSCFGVARVISSAAERCVATVRPFATLTVTDLEIEATFTIGQAADPAGPRGGDPGGAPDGGSGGGPGASRNAPDSDKAALTAAVAAILESGRPTVICAHGENLPEMLAAACAHLGTPPPEGPRLAKSAFWVLHVASGVLAAAERHSPSATARAPIARPTA